MRPTSAAWRRFAVVAALAACGCEGALAQTTYRLALSGEAVHELSCWEDPHFCDPTPPPDEVFPWTGHVDLVVASNGNGTFSDPDLLSVDFVANLGAFSVPEDNPPPSPYRLWPFSGSVTVTAGRVTSLDGDYDFDIFDFPGLDVRFSGMSASYNDPGGHHTGPTTAVGTLVMVPEPATWLLLLAALPLLAVLRRRNLVAPDARYFAVH